MAAKRYCVRQHSESVKHQKNLHLQSTKQTRQKLLLENPETSTASKTSQFHRDLCEMLISANIPLNKVSNKQFTNFMEKYRNRSVPTESTFERLFILLLWRRCKKSQKHHRGQQDLGFNRWVDRCWLEGIECDLIYVISRNMSGRAKENQLTIP
jgi:hypothetical protein